MLNILLYIKVTVLMRSLWIWGRILSNPGMMMQTHSIPIRGPIRSRLSGVGSKSMLTVWIEKYHIWWEMAKGPLLTALLWLTMEFRTILSIRASKGKICHFWKYLTGKYLLRFKSDWGVVFWNMFLFTSSFWIWS